MEEQLFAERTDLSELNEAVLSVRQQIKKIIVGQDEMVRLIIAAIITDGHVLLEGVPGVAKTLTAKLVAKSLDVQFSRLQFTPDLMPSDVIGTPVFNPKEATFDFKRGPIFSNVVLIDEINRAPAKTQAALFEVMEERQITVDGKTYGMQAPFMVLATQNPIEQEGTYRLPEAQLDRFLFKIVVPYPTETEEFHILQQFHQIGNANVLSMVQPVLRSEQITAIRQTVKSVVIDEKLLQFIAKFIHNTRNHKSIYLGASPRASLAIMNASKGLAAISGRDFVTPDEEMEGITEDDVIKQIIQSMDIPR
jgi:MoxR-like ATPase